MRRWLITALPLLLFVIANAQVNTIASFEYWFDSDVTNKTSLQIPPGNPSTTINSALEVSNLTDGLHTLNFRCKDSKGQWSSTSTYFFVKEKINPTTTITSYEYWFDSNSSQRIEKTIASNLKATISEAIDVNSLQDGLHCLNLRSKDSNGQWCSTVTHFFIKQSQKNVENKIVGYRYWFSNDFTNNKYIAVNSLNPLILTNTPIQLAPNIESTPNDYIFEPNPTENNHRVNYRNKGLFNIQFKDEAGMWSSVKVDTIINQAPVFVKCDTLQSKIAITKSLPLKDTIHFYTVNALKGDSLVFKTDKALVIDLFNPYGKKIKTISTSESTNGMGVHAKLDGAYYALVHGFGSTSRNYSITYTHIAKYSILDYSPKKVGNRGTSLIIFHGNGFDKKTKVSLKKENTLIISDSILNRDLGLLGANIKFTGSSIGKYDINIDYGDTIICIKNGIELEEISFLKLTTEIIGPSILRAGSIGTYSLKYKNNSNVSSKVIPIYIGMNLDATVSFKFPVVVPKNSLPQEMYPYFETNRLFGIDGTFKVYCFYIPSISAYEEGQLLIDVKPSSNLELFSWIGNPFVYEERDITNSSFTKMESTCDLGGICDKAKKIPGKLGDRIECVCGLELGVIKALANPLLAGGFSDRLDPYKQEQNRIAYESGFINEEQYKQLSYIPPLENPQHILKEVLERCDIPNVFELISIIKQIEADNYKDRPDCPNPPNRYNTGIVRSYDPNDKIGFRSPSGSKYFNANKNNFTYIINFENKSTATAPAQEVNITDTLDLNIFDINSFRAGYIKIGNKIAQAPYNVQNNTWEVDMRPEINLRAEVKLTLNKQKGIAHWYFKAINPMTDALPNDPLIGFLPPNDTIGSGQGCVSFSINLKDGIDDGESVKNRASIVFDYNEPIITPTWNNTKDITPPISSMYQPIITTDSTAVIKWQAEDNKNGSGIYRYNLFVKKGEESYRNMHSNTSLTSIDFKYKKGVKYSFYVTAVDSAGNQEIKTAVPDITLLNTTGIEDLDISNENAMIIYPNPSEENMGITVEFNLSDESLKNGQLIISSINGSVVKIVNQLNRKIRVNNIGKGAFIFNLKVSNKTISTKKIVVQ